MPRFVYALAAAAAVFAMPAAHAQARQFDLPAGDAARTLARFGRMADVQIVVSGAAAQGRRTNAVRGAMPAEAALAQLLEGTGLTARPTGPRSYAVVPDQPAGGSAPSPAAAPEAERVDETDSSGAPGDIVVTATRSAQSISRVPISVAAFSQDRIDALGARDFTDIAAQTPGVRIREPQNQIAIRGLSSNAGSQPTGVYIDETPIQVRTFGEGAAGALPFLFDLERVEVLRGPQGTLFGAGSLGGTVRYITPQPNLSRTQFYARAEVGAIEHGGPIYEAGAAIGMPIADDKLAFRVGASHRYVGGYVDRFDPRTGRTVEKDANYNENTLLRGALSWRPLDGLTITPSIVYQERFTNDGDQYWVSASNPRRGRFKNGNLVPLADDDTFYLPAILLRYDGPGFEIVSNTSWFVRDQTRFYDNSLYNLAGYEERPGQLLGAKGPTPTAPYFFSEGRINNAQRNFTTETRIQSSNPNARLRYVLGVFYAANRQRNVETLAEPQLEDFFRALYGTGVVGILGAPLLPGNLSYQGDRFEREAQVAVFGNANFELLRGLRVGAGLRWSKVDFSYDNRFRGPYIGPETNPRAAATEYPLTPRFDVNYQATDNLLLYASAAQGFRTGGINSPISQRCQTQLRNAGRPIPDLPFKSDSAWSYEVGAKGTVKGLRFDASAFHIVWDDIQQRITLSPCGITFTQNLGQVVSEGFDLQVAATPARGLTVNAAVGYVDARFNRTLFLTDVATSGPIRIARGDAIFQAGFPWQAAVGARYDFALRGRPTFVRADYEFASANERTLSGDNPRNAFFDPTTPDREETHLVRLRAGVEVLDGVQVHVFADNVLDATPSLEPFSYGFRSPFVVDNTFRPRQVGLTLLARR